MTKNITATRAAIHAAGGKSQLARKIGVKSPTVHQWYSGKRPLPIEKVIPVSKAGDWRVTPHQLNPDCYPSAMDGLPNNQEAAA